MEVVKTNQQVETYGTEVKNINGLSNIGQSFQDVIEFMKRNSSMIEVNLSSKTIYLRAVNTRNGNRIEELPKIKMEWKGVRE